MIDLKEIRLHSIEKIIGKENIDMSKPNIFVANHSCLMDIFYVKATLEEENLITAISSRLMYKNEVERKRLIHELLNPMPIEVHAGKEYSKFCLEQLTEIIKDNLSINIFSEGAYLPQNNQIYKPRTGVSRILYEAMKLGIDVNLIPIALNIVSDNLDLDNYSNLDDKVEITFLEPVDYLESLSKFHDSLDKKFLHQPLDECYKKIAFELNKEFIDHYIELYERKEIIWHDGTTKEISSIKNDESLNDFKTAVNEHRKTLVRKINGICN